VAAILDAEQAGLGEAGARRTLAAAGSSVAGGAWDRLLKSYFKPGEEK
jgi:hypothetical protein